MRPTTQAPQATHGPPLLTTRSERRIRLAAVGSAVLIAMCATVLSYAGLHALALRAGIEPHLALLLPIMIDGLQFVGSMGVVYSTLAGVRTLYPWSLLLLGVSISAWGNWHAAPEDLVSKLLHAASPIILALVLEEVLRVMRFRVAAHRDAPAQAGPRQDPAPTPAPTPAPAAPPASEAPGPAPIPVAPPTVSVPPATPPPPAQEHVEVVARSVAAGPVLAEPASPAVRPVGTLPLPAQPPATARDTPGDRRASQVDHPEPGALAAVPVEPTMARASTGTARERIEALLIERPDLTGTQIARELGLDKSHTYKTLRAIRTQDGLVQDESEDLDESAAQRAS